MLVPSEKDWAPWRWRIGPAVRGPRCCWWHWASLFGAWRQVRCIPPWLVIVEGQLPGHPKWSWLEWVATTNSNDSQQGHSYTSRACKGWLVRRANSVGGSWGHCNTLHGNEWVWGLWHQYNRVLVYGGSLADFIDLVRFPNCDSSLGGRDCHKCPCCSVAGPNCECYGWRAWTGNEFLGLTFAGEGYRCNVHQEEVETLELEGLMVHCWKEEIGYGCWGDVHVPDHPCS